MSVKNYLVLKHYTLTDAFFLWTDPESLAETTARYDDMKRILIESANLFLEDLDEIIVTQKTVKHDQYMFKDHMQVIDDLYHDHPCNIMYCDLDTVFIKPTKIFGEYDHFCMLEHQCGIRYYPHGGVPEHLWEIQRSSLANWDETAGPEFGCDPDSPYLWHREQDIFVDMINAVTAEVGIDHHNRNSIVKFWDLIHCVYNEWGNQKTTTDDISIIHYNGTGMQFDPVALADNLLQLAKQEEISKIAELMGNEIYRYRFRYDHNGNMIGKE